MVVQNTYRQEQAPQPATNLVGEKASLKQADLPRPNQAKPADAESESPDHNA